MDKAKKKIKKPKAFISVDRLNVLLSRVYQQMNKDRAGNLECHRAGIKTYSEFSNAIHRIVGRLENKIKWQDGIIESSITISIISFTVAIIAIIVVVAG